MHMKTCTVKFRIQLIQKLIGKFLLKVQNFDDSNIRKNLEETKECLHCHKPNELQIFF